MWNDQQKGGLKEVDNWLNQWYTSRKPTKQVFRLFGYAGTGKTTLARHFAESVDGDVLFGSFTGKASLVMRKVGCVGARTLHSLIYLVEQNKQTGELSFHLNRQSSLADAALLIVDECSMVDDYLGKHLLSFNRPILVLGDPAQLPPVSGTGFFTSHKPDVMLTEIHRQARDNPIIHLATLLRNREYPDLGEYGDSRVIQRMSSSDVLDADQLLVGRNVTRHDMNRKIRKLLKYTSDLPSAGERLICLQNDSDKQIFNGGLFTVIQKVESKYKTNFTKFLCSSDDEERPAILLKVHDSAFVDDVPQPHWKQLKGSQQMDYAYAITTHKAQGSQWGNVTVVDESYCFREDKFRWLYTAATRASEVLTLVAS